MLGHCLTSFATSLYHRIEYFTTVTPLYIYSRLYPYPTVLSNIYTYICVRVKFPPLCFECIRYDMRDSGAIWTTSLRTYRRLHSEHLRIASLFTMWSRSTLSFSLRRGWTMSLELTLHSIVVYFVLFFFFSLLSPLVPCLCFYFLCAFYFPVSVSGSTVWVSAVVKCGVLRNARVNCFLSFCLILFPSSFSFQTFYYFLLLLLLFIFCSLLIHYRGYRNRYDVVLAYCYTFSYYPATLF